MTTNTLFRASLLLVLLGFSQAQQTTPTTYADSSEGLQKELSDILDTAKSNDKPREMQIVGSLIMPNGSTWFKDKFGPAYGSRLDTAYRRIEPSLPDQIRAVLEANLQHGFITPKVSKYDDPANATSPVDSFLNCMDTISAIYETAFNGVRPAILFGPDPNAPGRMRQIAGDLAGYYVYDSGGFRYIPSEILRMLPEQRPLRIQLDWKIMSQKGLHRVPFMYPQEAISQHITEKVSVHLVVDTKGMIKEISIVRGPSILAGPTLAALKQWTFEPTTLDGDPVEVEINFETGIRWNGH